MVHILNENTKPKQTFKKTYLDKDRIYPNKQMKKLMPPINQEMILSNGVLARVVFQNPGKRRLTLEIVGFVEEQKILVP